jgi:plasmid maintenance system antidote protein VapI
MKTQNEISELLSCSQTTIHFIVSGQRKVSRPLAEKLSKKYPWTKYEFWRGIKPEHFIQTISNFERSIINPINPKHQWECRNE